MRSASEVSLIGGGERRTLLGDGISDTLCVQGGEYLPVLVKGNDAIGSEVIQGL